MEFDRCSLSQSRWRQNMSQNTEKIQYAVAWLKDSGEVLISLSR